MTNTTQIPMDKDLYDEVAKTVMAGARQFGRVHMFTAGGLQNWPKRQSRLNPLLAVAYDTVEIDARGVKWLVYGDKRRVAMGQPT